jgi:hypothetical protein
MMAITLTIEGSALDRINKFLECAKDKYGFRFIRDNCYAAHITLACGIQDNALNEAKKACRELAANNTAVLVKVNCISMMCHKSPLLYIRWGIDKELLTLRHCLQNVLRDRLGSKYEDSLWDNEEWLAKTSLIGLDTKYSRELLGIIALARMQLSSDLSSTITGLTLIKYGEGRELELETYPFGR